MKVKVINQAGPVFTLRTTRNVTLLESPEFGSMLVDGKMADSNAVASGKLELIVRFATRPEYEYQSSTIHYNVKDFKAPEVVYLAAVQIKLHDRTLGNYTSQPNPVFMAPLGYSYELSITENDTHESGILKQQLKYLVDNLG